MAQKPSAIQECTDQLFDRAIKNKNYQTYRTPQEFDNVAKGYIQHIVDTGKAPTITGLALWCGVSRSYFAEKKAKKYHVNIWNTIKKYKMIIESRREQRLDSKHVAGAIFRLKSNLPELYQEKQTLEIRDNITLSTILERALPDNQKSD